MEDRVYRTRLDSRCRLRKDDPETIQQVTAAALGCLQARAYVERDE